MDSHPLIPPHSDSLQSSESLSLQEGKWFNKKGERVWRAGTLVYTKKQLLALFFWLYIGQFTFWMQQMAIPVLFPLLLAKKGFSAGEIGTLWSVLPLGALLIFPVIGVLSDRTRTRFGRRRPYSLLTAPFWFIGFAILPFTHSYFQAMAAMVLVGFASAASNILNAFYNDVVPSELMGRFVGGMRFLGAVGALAFQLMLMPIFDAHPELIFLGIAGIGFIGEMLMLIMVKEGEYPPPPSKKPITKVLGEVVKEGFANRYIIFLWLAMGVTAFGGPVMGTYFNLFFTDAKTGLGLSTSQLGQLMSLGTAIGLLLIIPSGWCVDRFGPKRIWCWTGIGVGLLQISIFFVEKNSFNIYFIYTLFAILNTVMGAALLPLMYAYIPKDKFGQLSGSNAIVTSVLQIAGMNILGWLVTFSGNQYGPLFMFGGIAYLLTPLLIYLLSRELYPYGDLKTSMNPEGTLSFKKR